MREAMKGLVEMYVDRGDPAAVDFAVGGFTIDGAWHDLDLSALITIGAKAVHIDLDFKTAAAFKHIDLRKYGNSNDLNHFKVMTLVGNQERHADALVAVSSDRKISYKMDAGTWAILTMTIRGWWT